MGGGDWQRAGQWKLLPPPALPPRPSPGSTRRLRRGLLPRWPESASVPGVWRQSWALPAATGGPGLCSAALGGGQETDLPGLTCRAPWPRAQGPLKLFSSFRQSERRGRVRGKRVSLPRPGCGRCLQTLPEFSELRGVSRRAELSPGRRGQGLGSPQPAEGL